jgi:hypothetical protein
MLDKITINHQLIYHFFHKKIKIINILQKSEKKIKVLIFKYLINKYNWIENINIKINIIYIIINI